MKKRIFISLPVPKKHKKELSVFAKQLKIEGNLVPQKNYHITLLFLGEIDENSIPRISKKIAKIAAETKSFNLEVSSIENKIIFKKNMIWVNFNQSKKFNSLALFLRNELKDFTLDVKKQIPHITLAKTKNAKISQLESPRFDPIQIDQIDLMESHLFEKHAEYKIIKSFPFEK